MRAVGRKGPFKMREQLYRQLALGDETRDTIAAACLFLGYGPNFILEALDSGRDSPHVADLIAEAMENGFSTTVNKIFIENSPPPKDAR